MPVDRNINETIQKATDAGRNTLKEGARVAQAAAGEATKAVEQGGHATADIARQSLETARETLQSGLNSAAQGFQRVTDQVSQMLGFADPRSGELSRQSSQNIEAVSQAGLVLANGAREISQELFGLAQNRFTKNLGTLNRLLQCQSVQDFVVVQSDFVRDNVQQAIDSSRRVAELSVRVANEAAGTIQPQAGRNAVEVDRNADAARRVA